MNIHILQIPALLLCACVATGAAAQTAVHDRTPDPAQAQVTSPQASGQPHRGADAAVAPDEQAGSTADDRNCLRETGSRLVRADRSGRKCANAPGRSYTREDLERTGQGNDLKGALRLLDSSIY